MAQYFQGILGPFHGKVGAVVGYMWRDRWCMRACPRHYHDRQSDAQLLQRSRFKAMILFASPATPLLRIGMRQSASERRLTEGNCFLKTNHSHFSGTAIDYPRLQFSQGNLPAILPTECTVDEHGAVTLRWRSDGGRSADTVHIYAYCPVAGTGLPVAAVPRGKKHAQFLLPHEFIGTDIHLWAFAESQNGEVSRTAYAAPAKTPAPTHGQTPHDPRTATSAAPQTATLPGIGLTAPTTHTDSPPEDSHLGQIGLKNQNTPAADRKTVANGLIETPLPPLREAAPI